MVNKHLGVYGICYDSKLLVVKKNRGPYINRYDLPGGSFEAGESIMQCLQRELSEETGASYRIMDNLGAFDFEIKWQEGHLYHMALFYRVEAKMDLDLQTIADDSNGLAWLDLEAINHKNASPLVLKAVALLSGEINYDCERYESWVINKQHL